MVPLATDGPPRKTLACSANAFSVHSKAHPCKALLLHAENLLQYISFTLTCTTDHQLDAYTNCIHAWLMPLPPEIHYS